MKPIKLFRMACMAVFMVGPVQAAHLVCGDRTSLLKALSDLYKEKPRALGLSATGNAVYEVYTSQTGTWTIIMTTAAGITCIMAAGDSWQDVPKVVGEPA